MWEFWVCPSFGKMDFSRTPLKKNFHLAKDKRTKDKTDHVTDFRSSAGYGLVFFSRAANSDRTMRCVASTWDYRRL